MKTARLLILRLFSYIPTQIPVGMTAYQAWSGSVIELIGPIATKDDLDFCIAAEVMRTKPEDNYKPKNYFVKRVRAGASKQLAGAVFTRIREEQKAEQEKLKAAEAAKQAEATALKAVDEKAQSNA